MLYTLVVDTQPRDNPSVEAKEYEINIDELRMIDSATYDSLIIEPDRCYVIRRIQSIVGKLSKLDEEQIEELEDLNVYLFEGTNYVYLKDAVGNYIMATYIVKSDFTDLYPTRYEMNASIDIRANEIASSVTSNATTTILTLLNNGYLTAEQVNALVEGNSEDIIQIKEQLKQTITSSQLQIEVSKAIEGGVSYLKNTLFTIDDKGMTIATNQDEFNSKYDNKGMYLYSYDELIARYDKDGAFFKNLEITGELRTSNLRIMDVVVNGENRTHIHWIRK